MKLTDLSSADFKAQLGGHFLLFTEVDSAFDLHLDRVEDIDERHFSLVLRGGPAAPLLDGIYRVENAALGTLDLPLVADSSSPDGTRYVASIG